MEVTSTKPKNGIYSWFEMKKDAVDERIELDASFKFASLDSLLPKPGFLHGWPFRDVRGLAIHWAMLINTPRLD